MTKVFLSPSDQDNNPVSGGGTEQDYAVTRSLAAAQVLLDHGVEVRVSQAGTGDDNAGFLASIAEGNAWGPDVYVADHTNATGVPGAVRSGIQVFAYLADPASVALAHAVGKRLQPFIPGTPYRVMDGSHLGEVSSTSCPAVLIEAGYHDNPADADIIRTRTVDMGRAIGAGILDYLGITTYQEDHMTPDQAAKLDRITQIAEALDKAILDPDAGRVAQAVDRVLGFQVQRVDQDGQPMRALDSGDGSYLLAHIQALTGQIGGLQDALRQLTAGQQIDLDRVIAAAKQGAEEALDAKIQGATVTLEAAK